MSKSTLGTAFGFFTTITTSIISHLKLNKAEDEVLNLPEETIRYMAEVLAANLVRASRRIPYWVVVDSGQSLQKMIAAGKYDYVNSDITSGNFPFTGDCKKLEMDLVHGNCKYEVRVELVHYGRNVKPNAILKDFEAKGFRAVTLPELLAFGALFPDKQREFPIIALGSVWQHCSGPNYFPYLSGFNAKRELGLGLYNFWQRDDCRFAAVRKTNPSIFFK